MHKNFRVYRPTKAGTGAACEINMREDTESKFPKFFCFLKAAKQTGIDDNDNAKFDWDGGITMKLGEVDLGEILSVLERRKTQVGTGKGLFHQNDKGNKVLHFEAVKKEEELSYKVRLSTSRENAVSLYLSAGDASVLQEVLKGMVRTMYGL
jgi:hypothetical protein